MPIEARRALRLALVLGGAALIAFGAGWKLPYLVVILATVLAMPGGPPPAPKQVILLLLLMGVSCLWGLLLGSLLQPMPLFGWLLAIAGMGLASALTLRPQLRLVATLFILGNGLIAVLTAQSSALAVELVQLMLLGTAIAAALVHLAHLVLPEVGPAPAPPPLEPGADPRWIGLRSSLIMALPLTLALVNPSAYLMTLMKGAQLTQQVGETAPRQLGRELVGSTAAAGIAALLFWWLLSLMPGLFLLGFGLALTGLLVGERLYGVRASRYPPSWWQNMLVTMLILVGPVLGDNPLGTDIEVQIVKRVATFMALAAYAALMVRLLEEARGRTRAGVAR